jgi:hypothetical protein
MACRAGSARVGTAQVGCARSGGASAKWKWQAVQVRGVLARLRCHGFLNRSGSFAKFAAIAAARLVATQRAFDFVLRYSGRTLYRCPGAPRPAGGIPMDPAAAEAACAD